MAGTIYLVTNNLNGKQYVGQTVMLDNRVGHGKMVKQAYKKHGKQNFEYQAIKRKIADANTMNYLERFWIETAGSRIPNGYNIEHGGRRDERIADETRALMSAKSKGNKYRLGTKQSPETRALMSEMRKDPSPELRQKWSDARKGFKFSEETIEKIHAGNQGKIVSDETKAKIRAARAKQVITDEHKRKLSKAAKRQWAKQKGVA